MNEVGEVKFQPLKALKVAKKGAPNRLSSSSSYFVPPFPNPLLFLLKQANPY